MTKAENSANVLSCSIRFFSIVMMTKNPFRYLRQNKRANIFDFFVDVACASVERLVRRRIRSENKRKVEFTRNISASEFAHLCDLNLIFGEEISNIYRFNRTKRLKIGHEN